MVRGVPKPLPGLLLVILLLGFVIRLAAGLLQPTSPQAIDRLPDQREYLDLSQNLLKNRTLCFDDPRYHQTVYAYRMPGYPLLLAACGSSIRAVRIAQAAIDTSVLLGVFLLARCLSGNPSLALLAAAILAVNPFSIYFSTLLLSETLFSALILWAIWYIATDRWTLATLFLLASCYVRTTGLLFLPILLLRPAANRALRRSYRLWDVPLRVVTSCLLVMIGLFPWAIRNHNRLGVWLWTTTNAGITLNDGFNPQATGASDQRLLTKPPPAASINEVSRNDFYQARAEDWMKTNWQAIPALSLRKILRGWSPVPLSQDFGRPLYRLISAAYCLPIDLLCLIGLFSRQPKPPLTKARLNPRAKMLLIAPAILVTVAQVLSVGSIRYRMPAEAPLAVLAAAGMMTLSSGRMTPDKFHPNHQ
jgi:hypothetical protein